MSKKATAVIAAAVIVMLISIVYSAEEVNSTPQASPLQTNPSQAVGEWEFKSMTPVSMMLATMTIKKNAEGKYEGTWSEQWGESTLSDIKFENGKMSFTQTNNFSRQEMKTTYEGTVAYRKIKGKGHNKWGDFTFDGVLYGGTETDITGEWKIDITMPEREVVEKMTISKNADGTLAGKWEAERGENTLSDIKFEAGKLTFMRVSKFGDREFKMKFEGTVEDDTIKGTFLGEHGGSRDVIGTRVKAGAKVEVVEKPAEVKKEEPNTPATEKK
jgi:hypothetical protein